MFRSDFPALSAKHLRRVLDAGRAARPLPVTPLKTFTLVQNRLSDTPIVVDQTAAVDVLLLDWLNEEIAAGLTQQRQHYHLEEANADELLDAALTSITADFQQQSGELEAWSLVYYRFVRVDLDLSWEQLTVTTLLDARTLRRRQEHGLRRLVHQILQREHAARLGLQQEIFLGRIPPVVAPYFVGREAEFERAWNILTSDDANCHLYLTGPGGIGKTTLAQRLALQLLNTGMLENLAWVQLSAEMALEDIVIACLEAMQLPFQEMADLQFYCQTHDILIVLDEAENLVTTPEQLHFILQSLVELFSHARLIITCRWSFRNIMLPVIALAELDKSAAFTLMQHAWTVERPLDSMYGELIHNNAGGNPLGLTLATQIVAHVPQSTIAASGFALDDFVDQQAMLAHLYEYAWEHLDDVARSLWLVTWLFPSDCIDQDLVAYAGELSSVDVRRAMEQLGRFSLLGITTAANVYTLHNMAHWYLHQKITRSPAIKDWMIIAAQHLCTTLVGTPFAAQLVYRLVEIADILEFSVPEQVRLLRVAWPNIVYQGLWSRWRKPLEKMAEDADVLTVEQLAEVHYWLGLVYRWLSQYDQAEQQFQHVLQSPGQNNVSLLGAQALAELAVIYRLRGDLEQSEVVARQAWEAHSQRHDTAGSQRCLLELAQLDLDKGQPAQTLEKLIALPRSARATALACNAYIALSDLDHAYELARHTLQLTDGNNPNQARAQATMGRVYSALGQLEAAEDHLALALSLLEQSYDSSGAARTAASLAHVYYLQARHDEALALLEDVLDKQRDLGDRIGLSSSLRTTLAVCIALLEVAVAVDDVTQRDELAARLKHLDFELQNLSISDKDIGGNTLATTLLSR